MSEKITLVVPCYNEERRFVPGRFAPLLVPPSITLLLVNDGSADGTLALLQAMAETFPGRCHVLNLPGNVGKAEAVRRGLLKAIEGGAGVVGYLDADGATPGDEMIRLVAAMERERTEVVLAARVALAGHRIERRPARHYAGRVFATLASVTLGCAVYDTQCGAKLFKVTPALVDAIRRPFHGRWAFDVELLGRLLHPLSAGVSACPSEAWLEVPLKVWRDEPGSKLKFAAMLGMGWELLSICVDLRRRKAAAARRSLPSAGLNG
jgi:dolichyl-phosphate beta-glucosyltransferase